MCVYGGKNKKTQTPPEVGNNAVKHTATEGEENHFKRTSIAAGGAGLGNGEINSSYKLRLPVAGSTKL